MCVSCVCLYECPYVGVCVCMYTQTCVDLAGEGTSSILKVSTGMTLRMVAGWAHVGEWRGAVDSDYFNLENSFRLQFITWRQRLQSLQ